MDRKEFQNKMNLYKKAREENPLLSYWLWKMNLPDNLANTPDWEYNNIGAWSGGLLPTLEDDGYYHLGSRNPYTGEILKPKHHPTYQKAIESEIEAGYYPYEKNGVTYTKTYSPIGDLSGYANGTDGIEDPIEELKATTRTTLTPQELKLLMLDYALYSRMSGSISPILDIKTAADFTPVGNVLMAKDIYDAASYNDYLTAGLLGAAMIVPPVISKTAKKFVPSFVTAAADKINALRNRERALKATRENIYQKAIELRNRTIEDLYTNGAAWERAEAIKKAYGDDYPQAYRDIINQYENDYFNLPEPVVKNYGESKAAMSAKKDAIDRYLKTGQPAGYGDFEYQIDDTLEGLDYPTTVHELGHYVDFNLAKSANPDKNNSLLNRIKGDLSVEPNRLFSDKTSYFRTGSELKSYMNTLRHFMLDNNMIINESDKVSTRKIRKAIDALPSDMLYVKGAYEQFKDPKLYTKWFNKIPLLGVPGAAMYLENKEDNSYDDGTDGITQSYLLPEIVVTPSEYLNYYMKNIRPNGTPNGEYFLRGLLPEFRTNTTKEEQDKILKNLIDVYEYAGKPTINYNGFRDTAYYIPLFNSMNSIKDTSDLLAELAHPIQRKIGKNNNFIRDGIKNAVNRMIGKNTHYVDKDNYEYETHRVIEPKLRQYIRNGNNNLSEYLQK